MVTFGTVLGMLAQLPVYLIGVLTGVPYLPAFTAGLTLVFAAWLRWRGRADVRPTDAPMRSPHSMLFAWVYAAAVVYFMAWQTVVGWRICAYPSHDPMMVNGDEPYQVALVSELRHHVPPTIPTVLGQPLDYHWFVNAHLASVTWLTGASPALVLDRLWLPTTTLLLFALVGLIARNLTGSNVVGAGAIAILGFVGDVSPFMSDGKGLSMLNEDSMAVWDPLSPSLGFGLIVMLLVVEVARRLLVLDRPGWAPWALFVFTVIGVGGAKATALPMLLCGGILAWIVSPGGSRDRAVYVRLMGGILVGLAFSQIVLFRGANQGMWVQPLHIAQYVVQKFGVTRSRTATFVAAVALLCSWAPAWAGLAGLWRVPPRTRPTVAFLLGVGISGVCATLLAGHPHFSEDYFVRFSEPVFAILSAWGIHVLLRGLARPVLLTVGVLTALGGLATALLARWIVANPRPVYGPSGRWHIREVAAPYFAIGVGITGLVVLAAFIFRRTHPAGWKTVVPGVAALLLMGTGLMRIGDAVQAMVTPARVATADPQKASLGPGTLETAAWLRQHTSPDDVLATNAHYRTPKGEGDRDNRHAWIAGYGERRVLVEGWAYTPDVFTQSVAHRTTSHYFGFSDRVLLRENDAAFTDSTGQAAKRLHTVYGVDYLVVDTRYPHEREALTAAGTLVHRAGVCEVIRLR